MTNRTIAEADLDRLLTFTGGLRSGQHDPPNGACEVCAREAAYLLRALPRTPTGRISLSKRALASVRDDWTDSPEGSHTDRACQILNDAAWSSDAARTAGCKPLVLLREADAVEGWAAIYAEATIRRILPVVLRSAGLEAEAERCKREGTAADAAACAAAAAANAAYAAANASAAAAAADEILRLAVEVLLDSHAGRKPWETP